MRAELNKPANEVEPKQTDEGGNNELANDGTNNKSANKGRLKGSVS
jgi:hypothetical protein